MRGMNDRAPSKAIPADFLADTLAYIEAHLFDALSVTALAYMAGLSPYHFSRMFRARFGDTVIAYVRARRMQEAARRLVDGEPSLAELAFDCGFESQEAFTRAFRREFGVPPGRYKREAAAQHPYKKETPMSETAPIQLTQMDHPVHREAFTIAGLRARFDESNKSGIPALWPRLIACLPLASQVDRRTYGAIWTDNPGQSAANYMAGVEVKGAAPLPAGFERLAIAAQDYIVFRQMLEGPDLHPQMQRAAKDIWGERLPRLGRKLAHSPDFELYPEGFDPTKPGQYVDIYVPVMT
jgi:AraC family transcriptional regulator